MYMSSIVYTTEVHPDDVPDDSDTVKAMLKQFDKHSCHIGAWPVNESPTKLPVGQCSHTVHDVELNENGGLTISFVFMNTLRGVELMRQFDESKFRFVPVINNDGSFTVRLDVKEK